MLMNNGPKPASLSIVLNSDDVPLPFSGGNTSNEKHRFCLLLSNISVIRISLQRYD